MVVLFGLWVVYTLNLARLEICRTFLWFLGKQKGSASANFDFLAFFFQIFNFKGRHFIFGTIWHGSHYVFKLVQCVCNQKLPCAVTGNYRKNQDYFFPVQASPQNLPFFDETVTLNREIWLNISWLLDISSILTVCYHILSVY